MSQPSPGVPFDVWVNWIFNHLVTDPEWYWADDAEMLEVPPATSAEYAARLLSDAGRLLEPYSDAQVNMGLWFLASNSCSAVMLDALGDKVPEPRRRACIRAMSALYRQCFVPRCSPHLIHLDEEGWTPLNLVCYMWWDMLPICGRPEDSERANIDQECIAVMVKALELPSDACRESALHGLGHWKHHYPEEVAGAINAFLGTTPDLRPELIRYAEAAREGCVN